MLEKRYKTDRSLGYPVLDGKQPRIDTEAEYTVVGQAKACENRPIIERVDGEEYEGNRRWIVDHHNLFENPELLSKEGECANSGHVYPDDFCRQPECMSSDITEESESGV